MFQLSSYTQTDFSSDSSNTREQLMKSIIWTTEALSAFAKSDLSNPASHIDEMLRLNTNLTLSLRRLKQTLDNPSPHHFYPSFNQEQTSTPNSHSLQPPPQPSFTLHSRSPEPISPPNLIAKNTWTNYAVPPPEGSSEKKTPLKKRKRNDRKQTSPPKKETKEKKTKSTKSKTSSSIKDQGKNEGSSSLNSSGLNSTGLEQKQPISSPTETSNEDDGKPVKKMFKFSHGGENSGGESGGVSTSHINLDLVDKAGRHSPIPAHATGVEQSKLESVSENNNCKSNNGSGGNKGQLSFILNI
eukprot:TRINITY_DN26573_c0_g1_i1.p1 TRINITY_DN26573_c0_g1~~TRINITY_DN26573_c0_g1_i1.p1  ORF type:complete len:299 (-),score=85.49 TRINITY_DN26573_c0_g1_i1:207-1103(-)